jgi:hypothetical protein
VVKAFLLEVREIQAPEERDRNPTWFGVDEARSALAVRREAKYAAELCTVIDRALERLSDEGKIVSDSGRTPLNRIWQPLLRWLKLSFSSERKSRS